MHAFEVIKLDVAVSTFLDKWFAEKCEKTEYSYLYILPVEMAYKKGFYAADSHPSTFNPPALMTDIKVAIEVSICGWEDGYAMTLRKENDGYKVIGYTSFDQPE